MPAHDSVEQSEEEEDDDDAGEDGTDARDRAHRVLEAFRHEPWGLEHPFQGQRVAIRREPGVPDEDVPRGVDQQRHEESRREATPVRAHQHEDRRDPEEDEGKPRRCQAHHEQPDDRSCPARAGRPVEQPDHPQSRRDRPDEADLECPVEVLEAAPEEQDQRAPAERRERPGPSAQEDEHGSGDGDMEADEHREVGHVRPKPDDLHEEPVDDDGDRRPVLVVWREPRLHVEQRPSLDEGPLVAEEGQAAAHPEEDGPATDGDDREDPAGVPLERGSRDADAQRRARDAHRRTAFIGRLPHVPRQSRATPPPRARGRSVRRAPGRRRPPW